MSEKAEQIIKGHTAQDIIFAAMVVLNQLPHDSRTPKNIKSKYLNASDKLQMIHFELEEAMCKK